MKRLLANAAKKKLILWIIGLVGPYAALLMVVIIMAAAVVSVAAVAGSKVDGMWDGITSSLNLPGNLVDDIKGDEELSSTITASFDCSNVSAADRAAGNCIEGLLNMGEENSSPIPDSKTWLIPVWKKAADRYKVPWELVAAVNGARTNFGAVNCSSDHGDGFYRLTSSAWDQFGFDGGAAKTSESGDDDCRTSDKPVSLKADGDESSFDAVDASFAVAQMLGSRGASEEGWKYSGSGVGKCVVDAKKEGEVFYMPDFTGGTAGQGARLGYNRNLEIDEKIVKLAATYRSDTGKWRPGRVSASMPAMPPADVRKILTEVWSAFGASGRTLQSNVDRNMAQVARESTFRPQVLQGYIGDVNDNNPAGGLVQFIPGTFNTWAVDGFNDRFNPLDNLLAAVNAQINAASINGGAPDGVLDGRSGWGPSGGSNPYLRGGRSTAAVGGGSSSTPAQDRSKPVAYEGAKQDDATSEAVAFNGRGEDDSSDCYVAIVNEWYEGIVNNPPLQGVTAHGARGRIVQIAQRELGKNVREATGSNDGQPVTLYKFPSGQPWCAYFQTWVWDAAGVDIPHYGLVNDVAAWGRQKNLWKPATATPEPGDAIIYNNGQHVGIVEKVVGNQFTSIGGNQSNAITRWGPSTAANAPLPITGFVSPTREKATAETDGDDRLDSGDSGGTVE